MVVMCPKCRVKLKVDDAKIGPQGTRFKCPKCSAVLSVKRPAAKTQTPSAAPAIPAVPKTPQTPATSTTPKTPVVPATSTAPKTPAVPAASAVPKTSAAPKVIVAHSDPALRSKITALLSAEGYDVIAASDGIEVMVKAIKERPFLGIVEVALPKIYGFEICKRLKSRPETKEMKFILLPAIHDRSKYRREPVSLYGADEYLEEHELDSGLIPKINRLRGIGEEEKPEKEAAPAPEAARPVQPAPQKEVPKPKEPAQPAAAAISAAATGPSENEKIEKAKRLARTIINDIYLYSSAKVDASIRNNNFYAVFAAEIKEGQKLYDSRIPQEIRNIHNYYREAIENFLAAKKSTLT